MSIFIQNAAKIKQQKSCHFSYLGQIFQTFTQMHQPTMTTTCHPQTDYKTVAQVNRLPVVPALSSQMRCRYL